MAVCESKERKKMRKKERKKEEKKENVCYLTAAWESK